MIFVQIVRRDVEAPPPTGFTKFPPRLSPIPINPNSFFKANAFVVMILPNSLYISDRFVYNI